MRRALPALVVALGGLAIVAWPGRAPGLVAVALASAFFPIHRAWRAARGTALRAAVLWCGIAVACALIGQAVAWSEPIAHDRPIAGHWTYLATLTTLAALISVLNARTPGGGAWALLMALLVLVFLLPWLEAPGLARQARDLGRLRLGAPWTIFFGLLVVAGVTNYLPTRFGPAALWLALGFGAEYLGLTRGPRAVISGGAAWSVFPWTLAAAVWTADWRARGVPVARCGLEARWLWFRDHWGVVWALRVQERFNRSSEQFRWPVRLSWYGVVAAPGAPVEPAPEAAMATFQGLLRRFADPARIDEAAARLPTDTCDPTRGQ